jgi:hypothetical protein
VHDPVLQLDELSLQADELAEIEATVDGRRAPSRPIVLVVRSIIVIDLHFELFVEIIEGSLVDTPNELAGF